MPEEVKKQSIAILADSLTEGERATLLRLRSLPEYRVLVKLLDAVCTSANNDAIKTDPESANYITILTSRQQRARNFSELASWLLKSIDSHSETVKKTQNKENEEADDKVAKVFGIHTVKPKPKQQ